MPTTNTQRIERTLLHLAESIAADKESTTSQKVQAMGYLLEFKGSRTPHKGKAKQSKPSALDRLLGSPQTAK